MAVSRSDPGVAYVPVHSFFYKKPPRQHILPLVYTYHMANERLCTQLLDDLHATHDPLLLDCTLLKARRRNRNLADLLVHNKL